jgi:hypothetical protein
MAVTPKICILTVHGIGFQQPPQPRIPGYADGLHRNLAAVLGEKLGNDPNRQPETDGPVYVMSAKPKTHDHEWGLSRLGSWRDGAIDVAGTPLAEPDRPFAHVALIYTSLENVGPRFGSGAGTVSEAGLLLGQYASVAGAMRLLCGDAWAALHNNGAPAGEAALRPRTDLVAAHQFSIFRFLHPDMAANQPGGSLLGTLMTLEDDVVAYVCRNDLRESVKAFIREAVRRLVARGQLRRTAAELAAGDVAGGRPVDGRQPAAQVRRPVLLGRRCRRDRVRGQVAELLGPEGPRRRPAGPASGLALRQRGRAEGDPRSRAVLGAR